MYWLSEISVNGLEACGNYVLGAYGSTVEVIMKQCVLDGSIDPLRNDVSKDSLYSGLGESICFSGNK